MVSLQDLEGAPGLLPSMVLARGHKGIMNFVLFFYAHDVFYCRFVQGITFFFLQVLKGDPVLLPIMVPALGHKGILCLLPHLGAQAVPVYQRCHLLADDLHSSLDRGFACDPKVPASEGRHHTVCLTLKRVTSGQHCKLSAACPWPRLLLLFMAP